MSAQRQEIRDLRLEKDYLISENQTERETLISEHQMEREKLISENQELIRTLKAREMQGEKYKEGIYGAGQKVALYESLDVPISHPPPHPLPLSPPPPPQVCMKQDRSWRYMNL